MIANQQEIKNFSATFNQGGGAAGQIVVGFPAMAQGVDQSQRIGLRIRLVSMQLVGMFVCNATNGVGLRAQVFKQKGTVVAPTIGQWYDAVDDTVVNVQRDMMTWILAQDSGADKQTRQFRFTRRWSGGKGPLVEYSDGTPTSYYKGQWAFSVVRSAGGAQFQGFLLVHYQDA